MPGTIGTRHLMRKKKQSVKKVNRKRNSNKRNLRKNQEKDQVCVQKE